MIQKSTYEHKNIYCAILEYLLIVMHTYIEMDSIKKTYVSNLNLLVTKGRYWAALAGSSPNFLAEAGRRGLS